MSRVEVQLGNSLDEIPGLAATVEAFGEDHDLSPKLVFQLNLALEELVTNIICHAYDDELPHLIRVTLGHEGGRVTAEVEDHGRPFIRCRCPDPRISSRNSTTARWVAWAST